MYKNTSRDLMDSLYKSNLSKFSLATPRYSPLVAAIFTAITASYAPSALAGAVPPPLPPVFRSPDVKGVEIRVSTTSVYDVAPAVAMDADGDFIVVWEGVGAADNQGVYAQRYTEDGAKAGVEFLVNTTTGGSQRKPSVAMDADGDFAVAWESPDGDAEGVYARRFSADGAPASDEFLVNTQTTSERQFTPSIAMDADGDFVVSWASGQGIYNTYAQRYSREGTAEGTAFLVNTQTNVRNYNASVAMDADGDFVVAWERATYNVFAQRYSALGIPVGSEIAVNTVTNDFQRLPSVAMDADGDFVISWVDRIQDGDGYGVYAQRFSADGEKAGGEIPVNSYTTNVQRNTRVAMDADGDFVVTWHSQYQDNASVGGSYGVYAQRYNADGSLDSSEFLVNTVTTGNEQKPAIAIDADGDFIIAWYESLGQVSAQRFSGAGETVDLNLVVNDDTDPVTLGNNFIYSLITTNNGTGIAMDVNLSEPLPTGITYVSDDAAAAGWNCGMAATALECNLPFMNPGATNTISVTVTASAAGTATNDVTASSAHVDANPADNADSESTEIVASTEDDASTDAPAAGGSSSSSLSWFSGLLLLPLVFRRRFNRRSH